MPEMISSTPNRVARFPIVEPFGCDHLLYPHAIQFYLGENFLLSVLCNFVLSALKRGDGVVMIATKVHRDGILKRLALLGIDVASLELMGSYVEMDAHETLAGLMVQGVPDFERFTEVIGGAVAAAKDASDAADPRVLVFGEMVPLLCARGQLESALALERFWKLLAGKFSFSLLCGYPMTQFAAAGSEDSFLRICACYSTVSPPEAFATPDSEERILRATAQSYVDASFAEALRVSHLRKSSD